MKIRAVKPITKSQQQITIILAVTLLPLSSLAADFAGGTGEPNDPYQIATAEQLLSLGKESLWGRHYVLIDDIDMRTAWPYSCISYFWGTLDGQGHTIRNLSIVPGEEYQGLFGALDYRPSSGGRRLAEARSDQGSAEISNLKIEDAYIASSAYTARCVGMLAGMNRGLIVNCHVSGTIAIEGDTSVFTNIGGLVGENRGEILGCSTDCSIQGSGPTGGLVGLNLGIIAQCQTQGDVTGINDVGGLVGSNGSWGYPDESQRSLIQSCFSDAIVYGQFNVGGLVGSHLGTLCFSQADGLVIGQIYTGGLVGVNSYEDFSAVIFASCATGTVIYTGEAGGSLVGSNNERGFVSDCYSWVAFVYNYDGPRFVGQSSGHVQRCFALEERSAFGYARSSYQFSSRNEPGYITWEQMMDPDTFVGWDFYGRTNDGRLDDWFIPEVGLIQLSWQVETNNMIPVPLLRGESIETAERRLNVAGLRLGEIVYDTCADESLAVNDIITTRPCRYGRRDQAIDVVVNTGRFLWDEEPVSEPLEIRTPGQLDCLAARPDLWDRFIVLAADLDMTGWIYRKPLFDGSFNGVLDGQDHTISNLVIDQLFEDTVGLFREVGSDGYVGHLVLNSLSVSGGGIVGSIAGTNNGVIQSVSVEANVTGAGPLGGLVGTNIGDLLDCHVTGRINPLSVYDRPGSLVGCESSGSHVQCSAEIVCPSIEEPLELVGGYCGGHGGGR